MMIIRAALTVVLALDLLAAPLAVEAQQARVYRIGVILQGGQYSAAIDGLRDGLRELGLEEGKQFVLHVPLRIELRRLRSLKLIGMRGDHRVGEIEDGWICDLGKYVELTELSERWVRRIREIEERDVQL